MLHTGGVCLLLQLHEFVLDITTASERHRRFSRRCSCALFSLHPHVEALGSCRCSRGLSRFRQSVDANTEGELRRQHSRNLSYKQHEREGKRKKNLSRTEEDFSVKIASNGDTGEGTLRFRWYLVFLTTRVIDVLPDIFTKRDREHTQTKNLLLVAVRQPWSESSAEEKSSCVTSFSTPPVSLAYPGVKSTKAHTDSQTYTTIHGSYWHNMKNEPRSRL